MIGGANKILEFHLNTQESDQSLWLNIGKLKHARYGHLAFFAPISALPNCKKTYFEIPTH